MLHKNKVIWISTTVIGFIVLAGIAGISIHASEPSAHSPNDRANHHPLKPNN